MKEWQTKFKYIGKTDMRTNDIWMCTEFAKFSEDPIDSKLYLVMNPVRARYAPDGTIIDLAAASIFPALLVREDNLSSLFEEVPEDTKLPTF